MKTQLIKISDLVLDKDIYPRTKVNWLTAYNYAMAMKAGAKFPPVTIGRFEGKLYLVDGWHRVGILDFRPQHKGWFGTFRVVEWEVLK